MPDKPIVAYDNTCEFCTSAKLDMGKIDRKKELKWVGIINFNYKKLMIKNSLGYYCGIASLRQRKG